MENPAVKFRLQMYLLLAIGLVLLICPFVSADTPAVCFGENVFNCTNSRCTWEVSFSRPFFTPANCSNDYERFNNVKVLLKYPNSIVFPDSGHVVGTWTMMYNQGMELRLGSFSFFFFFDFEQTRHGVISHCDRTIQGWYHNKEAEQFGCASAKRLDYSPPTPWQSNIIELSGNTNSKPTFTTTKYDFDTPVNGRIVVHEKKSIDQSRQFFDPALHPPDLPTMWDWSLLKVLSPPKHTLRCGSCYVFAFTYALEARFKIKSMGAIKPTLSDQMLVDCNYYAQKCRGGFSFAVSRFVLENGVVASRAYKYTGEEGTCRNLVEEERFFVKDYYPVNGYYGNHEYAEDAIMRELYENGPVTASLFIPRDGSFQQYKEGIYYNPEQPDRHGFYVEISHEVTIIGWGISPDNRKYWKVLNSWGANWGEWGTFKIPRGIDHLGIESYVVAALPLV
ncbi:hypothetical protein RCL1_005471 [Eukaryota sp. TZLM3-RCL]